MTNELWRAAMRWDVNRDVLFFGLSGQSPIRCSGHWDEKAIKTERGVMGKLKIPSFTPIS